MLLVKTRLEKSTFHGIGLYADQFIPKGTTTWKYHPHYDTAFSPALVKKMPARVRNRFLDYAYLDREQNMYILCFDDQRFINHSFKPNIKSTPTMDVANRDILRGEELTCNYEEYEKNWFKNRGLSKNSFR